MKALISTLLGQDSTSHIKDVLLRRRHLLSSFSHSNLRNAVRSELVHVRHVSRQRSLAVSAPRAAPPPCRENDQELGSECALILDLILTYEF